MPESKENCNKGERYQTIYEIKCDPNVESVQVLNINDFDPTVCKNTIKMVSKFGIFLVNVACFTGYYSPWYDQLGIDKDILGYLLMLAGLFFLIFGKMFYKLTSSVITLLCSGLIIHSILTLFMDEPLSLPSTIYYNSISLLLYWCSCCGFSLFFPGIYDKYSRFNNWIFFR